MGNVEKRFREALMIGGQNPERAATLEDLCVLAALVDDEMAKAIPSWRDARKLVNDYGHTERSPTGDMDRLQ